MGKPATTWGITARHMRQLYTATVVPRMLYAASCWYIPEGGRGFIKRAKRVHRVLARVQHRALCLVTGAFRTTARAELEVDMHIPPIKVALYRAVESSLNRIRGSPLYHKILQLRRSAPTKYQWYSPLQKLENNAMLRLPEGTLPIKEIC